MKKLLIIIAAVILVGIGWVLRPTPVRQHDEVRLVAVQRGDVVHVLRETGTLFAHDPVLVKNRYRATLKWIVEDGSWVEKGDKLFMVSAEKLEEEVAAQRQELIALRQELRLAKLKRKHAEDVGRLELDAALRKHELETIRYRVLTSTPKGGLELIRVHEALLPLEKETNEVRDRFEVAQDEYLEAQDGYLEAQDAFEASKTRYLRAQARVDELRVQTDLDPENMQPEDRRKYDEAKSGLVEAKAEMAKEESALPGLRQAMLDARTAANALKMPLDELEARLGAGDARTEELYVALEMEKRGLERANLQLDEEAAELQLEHARSELRDGELSFTSGAISKATLEALRTAHASVSNHLQIVQQKLKIASRPPAPEELEEARTQLAKAKAEADNARERFDESLAVRDAEMQLLTTRIEKMERDLEFELFNFIDLIEADIAAAERELELLDPEDTQRRAKLNEEIPELKRRLEHAVANPPNVYKAPTSGIARLATWRRSRPTRAGDEWYADANLVTIYPPDKVEVFSHVNEVNMRYVQRDMPARVLVPSLGNKELQAQVYQVAAVAKDKFDRKFAWFEERAFADVTQFDVRLRLDGTHPDLRQGMTVVVELEADRRDDVLWLPAGAVRFDDKRFVVMLESDGVRKEHTIQGEFFGDDAFVVTEGLQEGDHVQLERKGET